MTDQRKKNVNWTPADDTGSVPTWERVQVAILLDLRDELQDIGATLRRIETLARCPNVSRGFKAMNAIKLRLAEALPKKRKARRRKA